MKILCRLGWHEADRDEVYNEGFYFSTCFRCHRDMIRLGGAWRLVPAGHRVAWRKERRSHSAEPDPVTFRPVLIAECRLPEPRTASNAVRAPEMGRNAYGRA